MLYAILCSYENSCRLNACSSKLVLRPSCSNNLLQILAAELASLRARLLQLDKGPCYTVRTHIPDYFSLRIDFYSDGKIVSMFTLHRFALYSCTITETDITKYKIQEKVCHITHESTFNFHFVIYGNFCQAEYFQEICLIMKPITKKLLVSKMWGFYVCIYYNIYINKYMYLL